MKTGRVVVFVKRDSPLLGLPASDPSDESLRALRAAHAEHRATIEEVKETLALLRVGVHLVEGPLPDGLLPADLILTVGGDGTLLRASRCAGAGVPMLGINSAPGYSVGFFCGTRKGEVRSALASALDGALPSVELTRMQVEQNGMCLSKRVLNEALFCHPCPAVTSRYRLQVLHEDGSLEEEEQRSSGLWIGPAAGSTAAQRSAGGYILPLQSNALQYVVREPYTPRESHCRLPRGEVSSLESVHVENRLEEARLYLDGHALSFRAQFGDRFVFRRSEEPLTLLGLCP